MKALVFDLDATIYNTTDVLVLDIVSERSVDFLMIVLKTSC